MNIFTNSRARADGRKISQIKYIICKIKRRIKYADMTAVTAVTGCALLLISPQTSVAAAKKGMDLWWSTVVPSLLPFFIFTDMLMAAGVHRIIGIVFQRPVSFLLGVPGQAAFVFVSSILSGYPAGARLIGDMRRSGSITREEADCMLSFCSTSGPLFIVGAAGTGMLHDKNAGYMILAAHCAGALVTGMIMNPGSIINRKHQNMYSPGASEISYGADAVNDISPGHRSRPDVMQAATDAVMRSLRTIGLIGGFIVVFTIITEYVSIAGDALSDAVLSGAPGARHAGFIAQAVHYITTAAAGLLEMTVGCSRISEMSGTGINIKITLCAFLISFGGLSVTAQTAGVLRGTDISIAGYIRAKLMHGLISAAIVVMILIL